MPACLRVTKTILSPRKGLQLPNALVWSGRTASAVQRICDGNGMRVVGATVTGHTTPALSDVGCASVRMKMDEEIEDGGYLLALERPQTTPNARYRTLVPAIAAVPGDKGLDRHGNSRRGLAECLLMTRPILITGEADRLTFLHHEALKTLFPEGQGIQIHIIKRVHEFSLGLNAGTWLKIRMQQISEEAQKYVEQRIAEDEQLQTHAASASLADVMQAAGLEAADEVEQPPPDAAYLFDHMGAGGATGVSGQVVLAGDHDDAWGEIPALAKPQT